MIPPSKDMTMRYRPARTTIIDRNHLKGMGMSVTSNLDFRSSPVPVSCLLEGVGDFQYGLLAKVSTYELHAYR